MLLRAPTLAALRLTLWSAVVDDRLGTGERIDGLALGKLGSALRRLVFMLWERRQAWPAQGHPSALRHRNW